MKAMGEEEDSWRRFFLLSAGKLAQGARGDRVVMVKNPRWGRDPQCRAARGLGRKGGCPGLLTLLATTGERVRCTPPW